MGALWLGYIPLILDEYIMSKFFFWLPQWFDVAEFTTNIGGYARRTLVVTIVIGTLFNGVLGPLVEELYFRGYLLPRLSRFKKLAPFINGILFSLYHFHRPWQLVNMILFSAPMAYLVWKHKDIKISILSHMFLNIFSMISILPLLFI